MDSRITISDVEGALKRLNKKASPGPDKISAELLLAGKAFLMPLFVLIFNKVFSYAAYPQLWTQNFLKQIFKKGETCDPNNYRGIAIGSVMGKIFSLILLERLENRIESTHPISENQIGFKKGHRTADHIFVLNTIVSKIVKNERKKLFCAFIGFQKAYDRINRSLLLLKLQRREISGLFYRNIKSMYNSVSYLVKVRNGHLDPITSALGLKQGGVLSPLLFNLFIDDMSNLFDASCDPVITLGSPLSHLLYADDLVLMSSSEAGLISCLAKLENFCNIWQLDVNIKKSKIVIFNPSGRKLKGHKFFYQGKVLEIVQSYCYLGIDISCSGSFRTARGSLMDKASKAMFPLFSAISNFQLPCAKAIELFKSLIKPIALYNSENWATLTHHQITSLEQNKTTLFTYMTASEPSKVHLRFLKYILGLKRNCSNIATLGEVGEVPLLSHGFTSLLGFWHKTSNMPNTTLARQAYNIQMDDNSTEFEWAATVKYLLSKLGMNIHLDNPHLTSYNIFSKLCATKLRDLCISQWRSQLNGGPANSVGSNKLRFYKQFKNSFCLESYLNTVSNFYLRKCIAKFRCSDHVLEIETGRHKKLKVDDRICKICKTSIETEEHFLRFCPKYVEIRQRYFGNVSSFLELVTIMKCEGKKSAFNLANFLTKGFKIRKEEIDSVENHT